MCCNMKDSLSAASSTCRSKAAPADFTDYTHDQACVLPWELPACDNAAMLSQPKPTCQPPIQTYP